MDTLTEELKNKLIDILNLTDVTPEDIDEKNVVTYQLNSCAQQKM